MNNHYHGQGVLGSQAGRRIRGLEVSPAENLPGSDRTPPAEHAPPSRSWREPTSPDRPAPGTAYPMGPLFPGIGTPAADLPAQDAGIPSPPTAL